MGWDSFVSKEKYLDDSGSIQFQLEQTEAHIHTPHINYFDAIVVAVL